MPDTSALYWEFSNQQGTAIVITLLTTHMLF